MAKRPRPARVGPLSCSIVRGPRADGRWYWRIRHAEDVKACLWATRDEVQEHAARLVVDPKAAVVDDECRTVRDLLELYLGHLKSRSPAPAPRSVDTWRATSRALGAELDDVRIDRLDLSTLDRYIAGRADHGCRKKGETGRRIASLTIRRELDYLARAWEWARERGLVPDRSLRLPDLHARAEVDRYTPTQSEVGAVLPHLRPWAALCVRVLYATGLRIGELGGLRREDIRESGEGLVTLRVDGKTGRRDVVIGGPIARELLALPPGRVVHLTPLSLSTSLPIQIAEACGKAGVTHWTPHGLRRLAVDRLYRATVDPKTAGAMLGHSPEVAMEHYRKVRADDLASAATAARMGELPPAGEVIAFRPGPS